MLQRCEISENTASVGNVKFTELCQRNYLQWCTWLVCPWGRRGACWVPCCSHPSRRRCPLWSRRVWPDCCRLPDGHCPRIWWGWSCGLWAPCPWPRGSASPLLLFVLITPFSFWKENTDYSFCKQNTGFSFWKQNTDFSFWKQNTDFSFRNRTQTTASVNRTQASASENGTQMSVIVRGREKAALYSIMLKDNVHVFHFPTNFLYEKIKELLTKET